ncbi:N-acetylmuramoyl-L-alanine amidase family protein [Butyrivibrio sp. AE2032]|uniref:N-acetylmuramoyl-L-alanine amidase family protein n=1 Tax=Butyrivibrio sp. AE2032 TaxID=1458463 RepID=UPI0006922361|nr:N-acetylmuramoyl-L-alanine amidase family protein [Butyrivibrio sp. AE2032]
MKKNFEVVTLALILVLSSLSVCACESINHITRYEKTYSKNFAAPKNGWIHEDGTDHYYHNNISMSGWIQDTGKYYIDPVTYTKTIGWKKIEDYLYYFDESGAVITGWHEIDNNKYYFRSSGAMATEWILIDGKWYYFNSEGIMLTGWQKLDDNWYYLISTGEMLQDEWFKDGEDWYYFGPTGKMLTKWQQINGKWYFFYSDGKMAHDTTINGYTLGSNGVLN